MAPLPDNLTERLYLDYVAGTGGIEHTMLVRWSTVTATLTQTMAAVESLFDFIAGSLWAGWRFTGARNAAVGSDFSLPVPLSTGLAAVLGTGSARDAVADPREARWVGRSPTSGRRVSLSVYGTAPSTPANYRWGPGEVALTDNAVLALLNAAPGTFLAIDGSKPVFYPYVNVQFNSYWETRARVS